MNASAATEYHVSLSMLDYELNRAAERSATPRAVVPFFGRFSAPGNPAKM
jgi:hypothetical protein